MNKNMFPVKYDEKLWKEKDCNGVFLSYYHSPYSLRFNSSVYIGDGISIFPDGSLTDE